MTTAINRRSTKERLARATVFGFLALAAMICSAPEARAQWTAPDAQGNISTTNTGRVGVGVAAPSRAKFEVWSDQGVAAGEHGLIYVSRSGTGSGGVMMGYRANGTSVLGGYLRGISNLPLFVGTVGAPQAITITDNGNVGFGTTSPTRPLEVSAASGEAARLYRNDSGLNYGVNIRFALNNIGGAQVDYAGVHGQVNSNTTGAEKGNLLFTTATGGVLTEKVRIDGNGNVGIGTASPAQALHVRGKGLVQNTGTASAFIMDRTDGKIASMGAGGDSATFAYDNTGVFKIESNTRANINTGAFGSGATTRLIIDGAGNVGIGATTLDAANRLTVEGNVHVSGNISAKYQDVAEWVPSTQRLAAATVVILDPQRNNQVLASTSAYDTSVAGVISVQPGIALGERGEGKVLVATTGRVKVKVDATRAPVKVGDLLVTSEREGYAMKSEPMLMGGRKFHSPGTIVGKALEPLAGGTGEILVLLSLQ